MSPWQPVMLWEDIFTSLDVVTTKPDVGGALLEQVEASGKHPGAELEKQVQLGALSLEDLEAELSRRRDVAAQNSS